MRYVLLLVFSMGCTDIEQEAKANIDERIVYVQDVRTGLCFAAGWGGTSRGGPMLTNVPCTDAVIKLLK
jgi:hypothetical protein